MTYDVFFCGFLVGISLRAKKLCAIEASKLVVDGGLAHADIDAGSGKTSVHLGVLSAIPWCSDQDSAAQHRLLPSHGMCQSQGT